MKTTILFPTIFLVNTIGYCQTGITIDQVNIGKPGNVMINYGKYGGEKSGNVTYTSLLAEPRMTCSQPNCKVAHFNCSLVPKGSDIYTYSINGTELSAGLKNKLLLLKDIKDNRAKLIIDSIVVNNNGHTELIKGILFLSVK